MLRTVKHDSMTVKSKSSGVMICRAYAWMLLLRFTAFLVGVSSDCPLERPGYCNTGHGTNRTYTTNDLGPTLCALNCDFEVNLCWYAQGCVDQSMTNWTAVNGSAVADQVDGGCGAASFSMLESPWVSLTLPAADTGTAAGVSCLRFRFQRRLPYGLDVFWLAGDGHVTTLLNRTVDDKTEANYTYEFTLSQGIGKLLFRLYGGGGFSGQGARKLLSLHEITHHRGQCLPAGTGCSFNSYNQSDQFCSWSNVNWETRPSFLSNNTDDVAAFSKGLNSSEPATLSTPLFRPTVSISKTEVDCLNFQYMVNGSSNSSLTVNIHLLSGPIVTLWRVYGQVTGNTSLDQGKQVIATGTVPIVSPYPYKVVFESRAMPTDEIGMDNINFTRNGYCDRQPLHSAVDSLPVQALEYCDSNGNEIIITTTTVVTEATTLPTSTSASVTPSPSSTGLLASSAPTPSYSSSQIPTSAVESSSSQRETTVVDTTTTRDVFTSTLPTNVNTTWSSDLSSSTNSSVDNTTIATSHETQTEGVTNLTGNSVTQDGVTSDSVTHSTVTSSTVSQNTLTSSAVPETTLTSSAVPDTTLTSSAVPETTLTSSTLTQNTLTNSTVPETILTGSTLSQTTLKSSTEPKNTLASTTVPHNTLTSSTLPQNTLTNSTVPQTTLALGTSSVGLTSVTAAATEGRTVPTNAASSQQGEKKDRDVAIIVGVIVGVFGFIIVCLVAYCIIRHCRLSKKYTIQQKNDPWTRNDRNGEIALSNAGAAMEY